MDYSEKIKAIQHSIGVEADGLASSKTWIAIYHQLFMAVPYDLNIDSMIKAVQRKFNLRESGHATTKTWEALYENLVPNEKGEGKSGLDLHNEVVLQHMTKEVAPFAKELIRLAAVENIFIKLMPGAGINHGGDQLGTTSAKGTDFGLFFQIGIYEQTGAGCYRYLNTSPMYARVAKIGNSIGLTCAVDMKTFTSDPFFELRPAWAVKMKEMDMIAELCRRKKENINLLAIL